MINDVFVLLADSIEKEACLKIQIKELEIGQKLDSEAKDSLYCEVVLARFEKNIDKLIKAGHSALDIYNALQIAEADSEDNEHFAGMFFKHSPNHLEKSEYYANHSGRPAMFEKKFKKGIYELFEKYQTVQEVT